jgi:hypothetical protein
MKLSSALSKSVDQINMYKVLYNLSTTDIGKKAIEFIDEGNITNESILTALLKAIDVDQMWNTSLTAYFSDVTIDPWLQQVDVNYHLCKKGVNTNVKESVIEAYSKLGYREIDNEEKAVECLSLLSNHVCQIASLCDNRFITHKTAKLLLLVLASTDCDEITEIDYLIFLRNRDWYALTSMLKLRILETDCYNPVVYEALTRLKDELDRD